MKTYCWNQVGRFLIPGLIVLALGSCASLRPGPKTTLNVTPDKVVISPALLKEPIVFTGTGFSPKEIVVVDMVLPKGVTVKGVPEGEDVGIGNGNADDQGNINFKMGAMTTLNTLFQVGWTPLIKPDFKQAKLLPPGDYDIVASGMESERVGKAKLTILPPPDKK